MNRTAGCVFAFVCLAGWANPAAAQAAFDACDVLTRAEAVLVLGGSAEPEALPGKGKRPRFVPSCTWWSSKEGKTVTATASFRFARSPAEFQSAFEEERLRYQTKPYLIAGAPAFWSAAQGAMQVLKGRAWMVVAVGGAKPAERDPEASRVLAEALAKKPGP